MNNFTFKIECRSGVVGFGGSDDYLICLTKARKAKSSLQAQMPTSRLIAQIFAPNGFRVPSVDLKAAYQALENSAISSAVLARMAAKPAKAPAHSEASTAAFVGSGCDFLAVEVEPVFSQAGVVAPPDSPDLGNLEFIPSFLRVKDFYGLRHDQIEVTTFKSCIG